MTWFMGFVGSEWKLDWFQAERDGNLRNLRVEKKVEKNLNKKA